MSDSKPRAPSELDTLAQVHRARNDAPTERLQLLASADGVFAAFRLPLAGTVMIGRSSDCEVVVDHPTVSRRHARIACGTPMTITDLGSHNGTRFAGELLAPDTPRTFEIGDILAVGGVMIAVQRVSAALGRRVRDHDYFEGRVEEECARAARRGEPFAVLRVALDEPARAAAAESAIASSLRTHDVLATYAPGDYELLVASDEEGVRGVLARLGDLLRDLGVRSRLGVAHYGRDGTTAEALIAAAAAALRGESVAQRAAAIREQSPVMLRLDALVQRVATSDIAVLIQGETGVGKEVLARRIHAASARANGTFLGFNCAALAESLIESELFGHERGAFTGATSAKPGLLESAAGGTVFLDEVGEMPMSIQAKLLRVIEEREVRRVGAVQARPIDVRFVAATNRDLEAEVEQGRFRSDLLFRINGVLFVVPPLRERKNEIEPLARAFIAEACAGRPAPALSEAALAMLTKYEWPGNIRELRNVIDRAVLLCGDGGVIGTEHLPVDKMTAPRARNARPVSLIPATLPPPDRTFGGVPSAATGEFLALPISGDPPADLRTEIETLEKQRILDALGRCGGNQTQAARLLGISRNTLVSRLAAYDVVRPRGRRGP
jgi:DNA-binding NtrC family response regulator